MAEPITLVIGAGASCPFGLPSGIGLRRLLVNYGVPEYMMHVGSDPDRTRSAFESFQHAFLESGIESIDRFLSYRKEYVGTGKLAIACHLLNSEEAALNRVHAKKGSTSPVTEDWIGWLFNRLLLKFGDVQNWPIRIITFNYDRIVEASFAMMRSSVYNVPFDESYKYIQDHLKLVHIYGRLDSDILYRGAAEARFNCGAGSHESARLAATGIRVIGEGGPRHSDHDISEAMHWILGSKTRIFLGFGFDQVNCRLLGLGQNHGHSLDGRWVSTAYGLRGREISLIKESTTSTIELGEKDDGCLEVLREFVLI